MNRNPLIPFFFILVLIGLAIYIDLPATQNFLGRTISTRLGLDLVGGVQALLEADLPANSTLPTGAMSDARQIVENRVNGLGVTEAVVQQAGERRILVEIPGETDPEAALAAIQQTGLLEFVDMTQLSSTEAVSYVGQTIRTDFGGSADTGSITSTITNTQTVTPTTPVFHTVLTGTHLKNVGVTVSQSGQYEVSIEFDAEGTQIFKDFTSAHVGQILAISLDKRVISTPSINNAITDGKAVIQGNFTQTSANDLAIQLRYGSLPVPLKVVSSQTVGPTLGQDSLRKSLNAGLIGLSVVMLFMALYYRLPGVLADLALLGYAAISYSLFRSIPVTLTLPGIAGFVLSIGVAVDANILIFERLKEELRDGRDLEHAINQGWSRAWPSIRDSNFSTLITCGILFWFGSTFGASIVKGFSLTLALGVGVSMFTAIIVTRTFLHLVLDNVDFSEHTSWFGI
jgi:preprotein translocase subunit SecD